MFSIEHYLSQYSTGIVWETDGCGERNKCVMAYGVEKGLLIQQFIEVQRTLGDGLVCLTSL